MNKDGKSIVSPQQCYAILPYDGHLVTITQGKAGLENDLAKRDVHTLPLPKDMTRCKGCRYPGIGFICWRPDGTCMRTDIDEIEKKRRGPR